MKIASQMPVPQLRLADGEAKPPEENKPNLPPDRVEFGDGGGPEENRRSTGEYLLNKGLNVAYGAGTGALFAHLTAGNPAATLVANAIPVAIGATVIGGMVGGFAAMVAAKNGKSGTKAFLLWGGGTALGVGATLAGAAYVGHKVLTAMPWTPAVNGAVLGAAGGLVGSGIDFKAAGKLVKEAMGSDQKTKIEPPKDPNAGGPQQPPADPKPPETDGK